MGGYRDDGERARQARRESPFLDTQQAAHYLCLSPRTLQQLRSRDTGPRFRRHSRRVRYHIDDLDAWSKGADPTGTADR